MRAEKDIRTPDKAVGRGNDNDFQALALALGCWPVLAICSHKFSLPDAEAKKAGL